MTQAKQTSAQQRRDWSGPALFSCGYRPFFLFASLWAAISMAGWIGVLSGLGFSSMAFEPADWHAHALLFGYSSAVIAGFLLTAVANWTGRLPIIGAPLAVLVGLWVAGRFAVTFGGNLNPLLIAAVDLSCPLLLALALAREIVAGRNWKNLKVLALVALFICANAIFHWQASQGLMAASGLGGRIGLAALIAMIALIGGRIVPSFTRNWLSKQQKGPLPASEDIGDKFAMAVTIAALMLWVALPQNQLTGIGLLVGGGATGFRLSRWCGYRTLNAPLVWVLHIAYLFIPLGFLTMGASVLGAEALKATAQHVWMAGGIGLMTLAVMSRASLGHGGLALSVGWRVALLYYLIIAAVFLRLAGGLGMGGANVSQALIAGAGLAWISAFGGFAWLYWGVMTAPRGQANFKG